MWRGEKQYCNYILPFYSIILREAAKVKVLIKKITSEVKQKQAPGQHKYTLSVVF